MSEYPVDRRGFLKTTAGSALLTAVASQSVGAHNSSSGDELWSFETGSWVDSSPSTVDGTVFVGNIDSQVYALDAKNGSEQWAFETGSSVISSPAVVDGTVFVGSIEDNHVYALDAENGSEQWAFETGGSVWSSPTVVDGTVFVGSRDNHVYALDAEDGSEQWAFETGDDVRSSPTVVDGTVFVGSQDGHVYALDAGVEGSSEDSRIRLGTLGHHHERMDSELPDSPTAAFTVEPTEPTIEESVTFDASDSAPTDDIETYEWDVTDDEEIDETGELLEWTFEESGNKSVTLTVTDDQGNQDSTREVIPVDVAVGTLEGEVLEDDADFPEGTDVYAIDALKRYEALDYVVGDREELPSYLASRTLEEDNTFEFGSIEVGTYVVLVDPEEPYDPALKDDVTVVADETTAVEVELSLDKYLGSLESAIEETYIDAVAQIEQATGDVAEVYVDGYNLFEDPQKDGADYLSDIFTLANLAMGLTEPESVAEAADIIKTEAREELALEVSERGLQMLYAEQWETANGTSEQAQLEGYTQELLEADGILDFEPVGSSVEAAEAFSQTGVYNKRSDDLEDALATFEEELLFTEPESGFSASEIKDIIRTQGEWFMGRSFAPGLVHTPQDNTYVIDETGYHTAAFQGLQDRYELAGQLDLVAQGTATGGKALKLTGIGTVAGGLAFVGGRVGSMALSMYQMYAKNRLGHTWTNSLTYWASDLEDVSTAYDDIVGWLESELEEPTNFAELDGTLETDIGGQSVGERTFVLANAPDYPWWWSLRTPLRRRIGVNEVTITNTGSESATARVMVSIHSGDDDAETVTSPDAASVAPPFDEPPLTLDPGHTATVEVEYSADFQIAEALSWNVMTTALWMDGKFVEEVEETFYVVPSLDIVPGLSETSELAATAEDDQEPQDPTVAITTQALSTDGMTTASDDPAIYGETTEVISDQTLEPDGPRVETTYDVPDALKTVTFVLGTVPGADVHLHLWDNQDRHVGFDPATNEDEVAIPDASYNGSDSALEIITVPADEAESYTLEVSARSFTSGRGVSTTVHAVEQPEREAVLSVAPTTIETVLSPGWTTTAEIDVNEIGNQVSIESAQINLGDVTHEDGTELPDTTIQLSEEAFDVDDGGEQSVEVTFDAADSIDLPAGTESRYDGTTTVETANAGTVDIDLSVLVLDTTVPDARLVAAESDVTGVGLDEASEGDVPTGDKPDNIETLSTYAVETTGEGSVSLGIANAWSDTTLSVFLVNDGVWDEADSSESSDEIEFTVDAEDDSEQHVVIGERLRTVRDYANDEDVIETDNLRDAIDDWRGDDIDTDVLRDVINAWRSGTR